MQLDCSSGLFFDKTFKMSKSPILYGPREEVVKRQSLGKVIFDSLQKSGQRTALVDAHTGSSITCQQLLEDSIKLASSFERNGIKKDDLIVIISENHINYAVPVLAALYLGAVVQPASPTWTLRELKQAFDITQPKWVISSSSALDKVKELTNCYDCTIISFEKASGGIKSMEELLDVEMDVESFEPKLVDSVNQIAFIFSSSGTTGLPKCVMITHDNMVQAIQYWTHDKFGNFREGDTTVVPVPLYHLFGTLMLLLPLVSAVKLVMINKFDPELFLRSIEEHRANKLVCPPPLVVFLAKSLLVDRYDLSAVEDIICGSASLNREIERTVQKRLNVTMRQTFATTETAGACTMVPRGLLRNGSCGTLLPNLVAKVQHPETKEVLGPNQSGEICFKGPVITKGYFNNPLATHDAFDENAFYCTGDIGYYDDDGYFFIVGRLKELIKYKAFQVAPAELEEVLLLHPAIRDAAVIGIPDERAGELPFAYVARQFEEHITEKEILAFVSERVSPEKRLHGVRFINEIPKNTGGKIKRQLLRDITRNTL